MKKRRTTGAEREDRILTHRINKLPLINVLSLTLGSVLYAAAIALFLDPNQLAPGGVSGTAIIINYLTDLPTGMVVLCINIPLMLLGLWKLGVRVMLSTVFCTVLSSFAIDVIARWGALTTDPLLAAIAGGALLALGMGLVFRAGGTTGGSDIIVRLIKLRYPYVKTGKLFLLTDSVIVAASGFIFRNIDRALYATIAMVVFTYVLDTVLYGADGAKLLYIITEADQPIAARLLELDVGVTYLKGIGGYTQHPKKVILCAMHKQIFPKAREIVRQEDPNAFMIVTSATEIFGEGFKDHHHQQL